MGLFSREPKPHVTYEVSEKYKKLRMFLIIVLLAIGVVAITTGIVALLNTDPGWQEVTVSTQERNCGANFIFQYHFSDAGASATELNKKVNSVYDAAAVKAYWLFTPDEASEEYKNIYYIKLPIIPKLKVIKQPDFTRITFYDGEPLLYQCKFKNKQIKYIY